MENSKNENQKVKFAYNSSSDIRGYATGYPGAGPALKVGQVIKVISRKPLGEDENYFLRVLSADYDKYEAEKFENNSGEGYRGYSYESSLVFFK